MTVPLTARLTVFSDETPYDRLQNLIYTLCACFLRHRLLHELERIEGHLEPDASCCERTKRFAVAVV